jgi:hypothetical protein
MTREKSSAPVMGRSRSMARGAPNRSAAVAEAKAASAASLTVTGYTRSYLVVTVRPWAAAMPSQKRTRPVAILSCTAWSNVRTVATSSADSGMMFDAVPAWIEPTVMTAGSKASIVLVRKACSPRLISQMAGIGSLAWCGAEPWPPAPWTVAVNTSEAASRGPGRVANEPVGQREENTWRA